jgi:hypothetical protein
MNNKPKPDPDLGFYGWRIGYRYLPGGCVLYLDGRPRKFFRTTRYRQMRRYIGKVLTQEQGGER